MPIAVPTKYAMFKIIPGLLAVALAVNSINVSAQNSAGKDEMFGQEASTSGEAPPAQNTPRKVRITNGTSEQRALGQDRDSPYDESGGQGNRQEPRDASASRRADSRNGQGDERAESSREKTLNEFQKFMRESTGKILPVYGAGFFANAPASFTPVLNSPLPDEHRGAREGDMTVVLPA